MFINIGLIGYPLQHSLSPSLHLGFLHEQGLNGGYCCFEVEHEEELHNTLLILNRFSFKGVNVTLPYKQKVMQFCDYIESDANDCGAVNTLKFVDDKIHGYNTDIYGFLKQLEYSGVELCGKDILLLGSGGASKAVLTALKKYNIKSLTHANRTKHHKDMVGIDEVSGEFDVVINSTSIGLKDDYFPKLDIVCKEVAIDLQYHKEITPFLSLFSEPKVKKVNGIIMLKEQAKRAFQIFIS